MKNNSVTQFPPHYVKICKPTKFHFCQCHFPQLTDVKKNTFQAVLEALSFTFTHHLFCLLVCCFVGFFWQWKPGQAIFVLCTVGHCIWSAFIPSMDMVLYLTPSFQGEKENTKVFRLKDFPLTTKQRSNEKMQGFFFLLPPPLTLLPRKHIRHKQQSI